MSARPLVHVIDDDESLRTALLRLLGAAGFDVQGYASTGDFLLNRGEDRPGCIVLDMHMPGPSGLELQAALRHQGIVLPVVFLTAHADVPSTVKAMKAGAVDFLAKPVEGKVLLEAISRALEKDAQQRAGQGESDRLRALFASLTTREREIFDRVVAGKLNKQIADDLGIAERTVKAQRAQLMVKLGASSAAGLGVLAERLKQSSGG